MPDPLPSARALRLIGWALATALLAWLAARAEIGGNLAGLLPGGDDPVGREVAFFEGQRATQLLAFEAWSDGPGGTAAAVRELAALPARLAPFGARPLAGGGAEALGRLERALYDHLPALLDPAALEGLRPRLGGDGLRAWLATVRERAARPDELLAGTAARYDLLGLGGLALEPLRGSLAGSEAGDGVVRHPDGRHAMLAVVVDFPPDDAGRCAALMAEADRASADAARAGVRLEAIGSYRHFRDNISGITRDLLATGPVAVLLIGAVLWSLVRSWRALVAVHVPAVLAGLGAIAAMGATGHPLPLMMIGFASAFLGISVENAIHQTVALQAGDARAVRRPLLVSYLTTAVAFAVLAWSAIPALRVLGILVVVGMLVALAASLTLLPALVARRAAPPPWPRATRALLGISRAPARTRLAIAAALTIALLPGLARLRVETDLRRMDGSRPATWAALEAFLGRWGSFDASDFLVADATEADPALAAVADARRRLGLGRSPLEHLLPDRAEQRRRVAAWNDFWAVEGPRFADELRAATSAKVFAALAPTLERYRERQAVPLVGIGTWAGTPFATLLDGLLQPTPRGWRAASPLSDLNDPLTPGAVKAERIERRLAAAGIDGAWVASRARRPTRLVEVVRSDLAARAAWMAAAMIALIWLLERRPRHVVAIVLPPLLALAWTFGLLGWMGVPLTAFSVIVAAFVGGVGLDNAVYLATPGHRAAALPPVLGCTVTTLLGVGSLLLATNPLLASAGLALVIGLVACLVACLLLTSLLRREERADPGTAHGAFTRPD
jgi:predicted exporter